MWLGIGGWEARTILQNAMANVCSRKVEGSYMAHILSYTYISVQASD